MARPSYAFTVSGIEPKDPRFRAAGEATHRAFWKFIAGEGIAVYCASRELGLDRHGVPMHPLAASTIARGRWRSHTGRGDPYGPALDPAHGESRTESLFFGRGYADKAEFGWRLDPVTGQPWGRILHFHRIGAGRLPVRDVMGFSTQGLLELARRGQSWWMAYLHGGLVATEALKARVSPERLAEIGVKLHAPEKFAATGRIDIEHATFGIGGSRESVARAIAEGYSTGFSKARNAPPAPPRGGQPKPQPKPAPLPVRPPGRVAASPRADLHAKAPEPKRAPQSPKPAPAPKPKPSPPAKPAAAVKPAAPKPAPTPGAFKTREQVDQWLGQRFPNLIPRTEGIPVEGWNVITPELDRLAAEYPQVAQRLLQISTQHPTGWAEREIAAADVRKGDALYLNPAKWQSAETIGAKAKHAADIGWNPVGAGKPEAYITHEWGHLIEGYLWHRTDMTGQHRVLPFTRLFNDANHKFDKTKAGSVSGYAASNATEAIAESFSSMHHTPPELRAPVVNEFARLLRESLG